MFLNLLVTWVASSVVSGMLLGKLLARGDVAVADVRVRSTR
jgi:hypothetical protein